MPPTTARSATTIEVHGRIFISHLYSSTQALDLLLTLGEVLAGPLSRLLERQVSADMSDLAAAVDELQDQTPTVGSVLALFQSIRKVGGIDLVIAVLQSTYFEDRALDSRKRLDEVFVGPAGVVDLAMVVWGVLVYQLGPLWDALRPQLSAAGVVGAPE